MKQILIAVALLAGATWAQNGGVVPPPDIEGSARDAAEAGQKAYNQAQESAARTALLRQQAALIKQQAALLKQQQEQAAQLAGQKPDASSYTSGNDFRDDCGAALHGQSGARAGICLGFIEGYRQLAPMLPPSANLKLLCLPAEVSNGQIVKVVVKYLDQHPEKLHLPAAQLIYNATNEAFPCPAETK